MITDIFIKTCKRDVWLLPNLLKSIEQYVTGFRRVIIIIDTNYDYKFLTQINTKTRKAYKTKSHKIYLNYIPGILSKYSLKKYNIDIKIVCERLPEFKPPANIQSQYHWMRNVTKGYIWQQIVKLKWTTYTNSDSVYIIDSDCLFSKHIDIQTLISNNHKVWLFSDWDEQNNNICWKPGTELILKKHNTFNTMVLFDFMFFKNDTLQFIKYICDLHKITNLTKHIINNWYFISEFNVYGNWCFTNSNNYVFLNINYDKLILSSIRSKTGIVQLQGKLRYDDNFKHKILNNKYHM